MTTPSSTTNGLPEQLMVAEYERSSEFCNHVDNVRNVVTSFFLTLVGAAGFFVDRYSSAELKSGPLGSAAARVVGVLALVWLIGLLFIMTIARLRRVQLERYRLMNRILDALLEGPRRDVITFRDANIPGLRADSPVQRRLTGSYFWTLALIVPSAAVAGVAAFTALDAVWEVPGRLDLVGAVVVGLGSILVSDGVYFRLAQPPGPRD